MKHNGMLNTTTNFVMPPSLSIGSNKTSSGSFVLFVSFVVKGHFERLNGNEDE